MREYLKKMGFDVDDGFLSQDIYDKIALWREWYSGHVRKFHDYTQYNGKKKIPRKRASLCMAKKICEDWANLLLNEKVEITTSDDGSTEEIRSILEKNDFRVRANKLCELSFALGTGAFCEYLDEHGDVKIDFYTADMIYPLGTDCGRITECAFCSEKLIGGKKYVYVQAHVLDGGKYVVKNKLFEKATKTEAVLPEGIKEEFLTGSDIPLFQIITPNIINNLDISCPMGISVFANAIDALGGVDLIYDSYLNEYRLGKKRIIVPMTMAQFVKEQSGVSTPIFDDNDTEFYGIPDEASDGKTKITEIDMKLRSAEHSEGFHEALDVLSDRCGLGTGRYVYRNGGVKTATEVISENSALYQNLRKHALVMSSAIVGMARAILVLLGKTADVEINVEFDDSIIHDTAMEFEQNMRLVSAGIMQKWEMRAWYFNESEQQAKKVISENADEESELFGDSDE